MLTGEHGQVVRGKEKSARKAIIRNNKRQMNVAMLKAARQAQPAVLHEVYLHTRMPNLILTQECREHVLNDHRRRADTQYSGVPAFEGPRARAQHISVH